MGDASNCAKFTGLLEAFDLHDDLVFELREARLGSELYLERKHLLWLEADDLRVQVVGRHGHCTCDEGLPVTRAEIESDFLVAPVDDWNLSADLSTYRGDSKVSDELIRVLEIKRQRNSLAANLNVDVIETVEVKLDRLVILAHFTWVEQDWDLELLLRHEYLSGNHIEVEMEFLLKVGFKRDGLLVLVSYFKDLLDGRSI